MLPPDPTATTTIVVKGHHVAKGIVVTRGTPDWTTGKLDTNRAWTITHAPSGKAICHIYSFDKAVALADALKDMADWDQVANTLHYQDALAEQVIDMVEAAGGHMA